jgi:tetratricopeptide (TPR) repeat protein
MRWVAIAAVLAIAPAPAAADKADALFAKGKALLAKKKYAQACPTFEKVDALDPGIGAKLNVARCYEEWGKLVRAHRWYVDAEKMAREADDDRAPKIKKLIDRIEPEVPRLTILVPAGADVAAAAIKLDGEPVTADGIGREVLVEPGPHVIVFRAGGEDKTKTIAIERGGAREVTLELGGKDGASGASGGGSGGGSTDPEDGGTDPPRPGRMRRIAAFALMGVGAASLGVAGYLTFDARDDYRSALEQHCMSAKDMCNEEGLRLTRDARGRANLATVFAIAGAAVAAGGLVLYLTSPSAGKEESLSRNPEALYLAPVIGDGAGLVVLGGRY